MPCVTSTTLTDVDADVRVCAKLFDRSGLVRRYRTLVSAESLKVAYHANARGA